MISLLLLVGYALVLYFIDDGNEQDGTKGTHNKLGILTTVSIVLMDIFNFLLYHSGNVKAPSQIIFLLILNRALMVGLGENYWIYGYIALYLIYALVFVFQIARNYFPLEGDIVLKSAKLGNIIKADYGKKLDKKDA